MDKLKRLRDIPPHDDYFMGLAHMVAAGSKNPNRQIGAVVSDAHGKTFAFGTDHLAVDLTSWDEDIVIHAEIAALHDLRTPIGGTLYVTTRPCLNCVCECISFGIRRIVYCSGKEESPDWPKIQNVMRLGYYQLEEFKGDLNWLRDHIKILKSQQVFDT